MRRHCALLSSLALATACASAPTATFHQTAIRASLLAGTRGGTRTTTTAGRPQLGGLLPGTASGTAAGAAAPPGGWKGTIKLGTVLPLEGGDSDWGIPVLRTTQAYIDEVNARGGVAGYQLRLIAYNACLTCQDDALQAVRRLIEQDRVFALVNTYVMVVAFQSAMPYLEQHGVPLIQGAAENQGTDALSSINFVTLPPGQFYVHFLADMAVHYQHMHNVGIAYLDVPSERDGLHELEAAITGDGGHVVDAQPVAAEEQAVTNMDAVDTKLRAEGADGVLTTNPVVLVFGRLAAARQGWSAPWTGEAAWSGLVTQTCGPTCDHVVLTDTAGLAYTTAATPQMREYLDVMARRYPGGDISGHTLAAWVGMQLTTQILEEIGRPDRVAFVRQLNQTTSLELGTCSPLTFSPDRHMGGTATQLLTLHGGQYAQDSGWLTPMRGYSG